MYIIPKGSIIPDNMALVQDERNLPEWDHYYLVSREPCSREIHMKNVIDFVVKNESRLRFKCENRPKICWHNRSKLIIPE